MLNFGVFFSLLAIWFSFSASSVKSKVIHPNLCPASCQIPVHMGQDGCQISMNNPSRWHFNITSNKCQHFHYKGCRGIANRFISKKSCMEKCENCRNVNLVLRPVELKHYECDCRYHYNKLFGGGCRIAVAPIEGWKCQCRKIGLWNCIGTSIQCDKDLHCPANCFSHECCEQGSGIDGNCQGYSKQSKPNITAILTTHITPKGKLSGFVPVKTWILPAPSVHPELSSKQAFSQVQGFINCGSTGKVLEVRVTNCTQNPCEFYIDTRFLFEVDFIPSMSYSQLHLKLNIIINGTSHPVQDVPIKDSAVEAGTKWTAFQSVGITGLVQRKDFHYEIYGKEEKTITEVCVVFGIIPVPE